MMTCRRIALLGLASAIWLSTVRAQPDPDENPVDVKTEMKLETPSVQGVGPYTVTIEGTLSLSKDEKGFIGNSAKVKRLLKEYDAAVSHPNGDPAPGMPAKKVVFTFTGITNKGAYAGTAYMKYKNSTGAEDQLQKPIDFEIK